MDFDFFNRPASHGNSDLLDLAYDSYSRFYDEFPPEKSRRHNPKADKSSLARFGQARLEEDGLG